MSASRAASLPQASAHALLMWSICGLSTQGVNVSLPRPFRDPFELNALLVALRMSTLCVAHMTAFSLVFQNHWDDCERSFGLELACLLACPGTQACSVIDVEVKMTQSRAVQRSPTLLGSAATRGGHMKISY